jgi:NhaP-type Na+/H+ or K+/H+ antiporter
MWDAMPAPMWGFCLGALVGVGWGLWIPDVSVAVFGAAVFGLLGLGLGALVSLVLRRVRRTRA